MARVSVFVAIVVVVHLAQRERSAAARARDVTFSVSLDEVREVFAAADSLGEVDPDDRTRTVLDADGNRIGYVLQTSPDGDDAIGFSGPTNVLVGFSPQDRVVGLHVLQSGDTEEHVEQVVRDAAFLPGFVGLAWEEAAAGSREVDAVSGATLTSLAMRQAVARRLAGDRPLAVSLKFPEPPTLATTQEIFPAAARLEVDPENAANWQVLDDSGEPVGRLLRTAFAAENVIGYQGPTEAYIGLDETGTVVGFSLGRSYDNEPYVGYVRDEPYYLDVLKGRTLAGVAEVDLGEEGIEGVSGATMTSMAVARGLVATAKDAAAEPELAAPDHEAEPAWRPTTRDVGTTVVVVLGVVVAFTSLRGVGWVRVAFQLVVVGYLGLVNGDLVSQASLVGWARYGVPWRTSAGLVLLTAAALVLPVVTKRNVYCSHLCPHGAAQQWLRSRLPWRVHLSRRVSFLLELLPALLLGWVVLVAVTGWSYSLVDVEPFDAYLFRVAGWPTIVIAVVGLVASLFVPMAYCRFGCPTGALLGFLRRHARGDRLGLRDAFAVACLLLAVGLLLI